MGSSASARRTRWKAEAQWQEYQKGLQRAFMKERQRYKDRVQQMKVERDEHTKMKDNAIRELHGLIEHPEKALTNMAPEAEDVAMDEWRDLITLPADPWEDLPRLMADAAHGGVGLQDAARKQLMGALGAGTSGERVERTPPRRPQQPPPMTPANADKKAQKERGAGDGEEATYAGGMTPAAQDPYLTSPSTSGAPLPSMRARSRSHTQGPRVSIKSPHAWASADGQACYPWGQARGAQGQCTGGGNESGDGGSGGGRRGRPARRPHCQAPGILGGVVYYDGRPEEGGFFGVSACITGHGHAGGESFLDDGLAPRELDDYVPFGRLGQVTAPHAWSSRNLFLRDSADQGQMGALCLVLSSMEEWHGPAGGHDHEGGWHRFGDLVEMVVLVHAALLRHLLDWAQRMQAAAAAVLVTLAAIQGIALSVVAVNRGGRKSRTVGFTGISQRVCLGMMSAWTIRGVQATRGATSPRRWPPPPRPTDLELWAAGQLTQREQAARAVENWCLGRPLEHNAGETQLPVYTIPAAPPEAVADDIDIARGHVTVWIAAPYYQPEIIDMESPLPDHGCAAQ